MDSALITASSKWVLALACILTGCSSQSGGVYQVEPPKDADAHVIGYQVLPRFTGYELTFGVPALAPIPIIGPALAEAIRFRAGKTDAIVVPILAEDRFQLRRLNNANQVPSVSTQRLSPISPVVPVTNPNSR